MHFVVCGFPLSQLDDVNHFQRNVWPRVKPLLTAREIQVESVLFLVTDVRTSPHGVSVTVTSFLWSLALGIQLRQNVQVESA